MYIFNGKPHGKKKKFRIKNKFLYDCVSVIVIYRFCLSIISLRKYTVEK